MFLVHRMKPTPRVHPSVVTLSSVSTDRWPKAGWLVFLPPLSSGGKQLAWHSAAGQHQNQSVLALALGNGRLEGRPGQFRVGLHGLGQG
jgi:hypothetical protein